MLEKQETQRGIFSLMIGFLISNLQVEDVEGVNSQIDEVSYEGEENNGKDVVLRKACVRLLNESAHLTLCMLQKRGGDIVDQCYFCYFL